MNEIFNRLKFTHHEEVFATREEAYNYVLGLQVLDKPTLVAEPRVLLYESGDDTKGPNVILAIGSVGEGVPSTANRTFFIDTQKTEEEVEALDEKLEEAIKSLTIVPLDSDTIEMHAEKTADGTFLSGDVKIEEYRIIDNKVNENIIDKSESGLYVFVDMDYDPETFIITFTNGKTTKEFQLPPDQHVVDGKYDINKEAIVLELADGTIVDIPVHQLIDEWTVLGEDSLTPIVLTKEHISGKTDSHGDYDWQDVLNADVRVADHIPDNILHKSESGKFLYVKGTADNIKYKDGTVADALDNMDTKVSTSQGNLIYKRPDGIYASAKLDYNAAKNTLVYTYTENLGNDTGELKKTEIKLNSFSILEDITYDPVKEVIVIRYVNNDQEYKSVEIPVSGIIEEWDVQNAGHSVTLSKYRSQGPGADMLSADVNIHKGDNNILEEKGDHELYVNGVASNIKYDVTGETTVKEAIDFLGSTLDATNEKLDGEIERAEAAEKVLDDKIGTGFTNDEHSNVTAKFNELVANDGVLSGTIDSVNEKLDGEIERAQKAEDVLSGAIDTNKSNIDELDKTIGSGFTSDPHENVTAKFEALKETVDGIDSSIDDEVKRSTEKDKEHDDKIEALEGDVETVSGDVETLKKNVETRIFEVLPKDASVSTENYLEELDGIKRSKVSVNLSSANDGTKVNTTFDSNDVDESGKWIGNSKANIIKLEVDGLHADVDLTYDLATNSLYFSKSGMDGVKQIQLQSNTIANDIYYDSVGEQLVFEYTWEDENKSGVVEKYTKRVDLKGLIEEWEAISTKSVTLTRERIVDGVDKLTADVNLSTAHGVENETVDRTNIIKIEHDGLHADVNLRYDKVKNVLYFSKTDVPEKAIELQSNSIVDDIYYDPHGEKEGIVIKYTANGEAKETRIDVSDLIREWTVGDTDTVALVKGINDTTLSGGSDVRLDKLVANVKVDATHEDNIIEVVTGENGGLYVSGEQIDANTEAIAANKTAIETEKNRAESAEAKLGDDIKAEESRAKEVEQNLIDTIGSGFTSGEASNITAKFDELSGKTDEEITRSTNKDAEHDTAISNLNDLVSAANGNANDRVFNVRNFDGDKSLVIENVNGTDEDKKHTNIKVNISTIKGSDVDASGKYIDRNNIIETLADGIHADVDLEYDALTNTLYFSKTGSDGFKTIKLASDTIIDKLEYDPKTENLILTYTINGKEDNVYVNLRGLLDEWRVSATTTVTLKKDVNNELGDETHALDILTAEVNISREEDNILTTKPDGLYVSNGAIVKAEGDIKNLQDALAAEIERALGAEGILDGKIAAETARATDAENYISGVVDTNAAAIATEKTRAEGVEQNILDTIGSGFTSGEASNITVKFDELTNTVNSVSGDVKYVSGAVDTNTAAIATEKTRAEKAEGELSGAVDYVSGVVETLSSNTEDRLYGVYNDDNSLTVTNVNANTENDAHTTNKHSEIKVNISKTLGVDGDIDRTNIIKLESDGLHADVNLRYDAFTNKLYFSKTGSEGEKVFTLQSNQVVDKIYYDPHGTVDENFEAIVIEYSVNGVKQDPVRIDVSKLIREWTVGDTNTIQLIKGENDTTLSGGSDIRLDKLVANVKISTANGNTIIVNEDGLYVSDADTVKNTEDIEQAKGDITNLQEALANEVKRATDAENYISGVVDTISSDTVDRISEISSLNAAIDAVNIAATDEAKKKATVELKLSSGKTATNGTDRSNILSIETDGLHADVNLTYDKVYNKLHFSKNGSEDVEIELQANQVVDKIYYDKYSHPEAIVIEYSVNGVKQKDYKINVTDLINEWTVKETKTIKLTKQINGYSSDDDENYALDLLTADVNVSETEGNMLETKEDGLYVSNADIEQAKSDINDLNDALKAEIKRASDAEDYISGAVDTNTTAIENEKTRAEAAEKRLGDILGSGFTSTDERDTVTQKFNELSGVVDSVSACCTANTEAIGNEIERAEGVEGILSGAIDSVSACCTANTEAINNEITRSTNKDNEHDQAIDSINDAIDDIDEDIKKLSGDSANRVFEVNNIDSSIYVDNVDGTEATKKHADIKVNISSKHGVEEGVDRTNIISLDADGLHADVDLTYDEISNTLYFSKTGSNGKKEIQLQGNSVVDKIYYDTTTESIVIKYKVNGVQQEDVHIDLKKLITEWETDNTATVTLNKARNTKYVTDDESTIYTVDVLTATVNIATDNTNILEAKEGGLFVSNSGITKNATDITDLSGAIDTVSACCSANTEAIEAEESRAKGVENTLSGAIDTIEDTIGDGFGTDPRDTITTKVNELSACCSANTEAIGDETERAKGVENTLSGAIDTVSACCSANTDDIADEIERAEGVEEILSGAIDSVSACCSANTEDITEISGAIESLTEELEGNADTRLTQVRAKDTSVEVFNSTDGPNKYAEINVHLSDVHDSIIQLDRYGLYADVNLSYNKLTNTLTFKKTGSNDIEIPLNSYSVVSSIVYNSDKEALDITYSKNGESNISSIPVRELIDEWTVSTSTTGSVELTKTKVVGNGADVLSAKVLISTDHTDNILERKTDGLYVSNSAITKNAQDIAKLQTDLTAESTRAKAKEKEIEDKLDAEITRSTNKDNELNTKIENETTRATQRENAIETALNNEITRSTNKDNELNNAITAETQARVEDVAEIYEAISNITLDVADTNSLDLTLANKVISGVVKINPDNKNIIKVDSEYGGLYANVSLEYNSVTNQIRVKSSANTPDDFIQLNAVSILEEIYYDSDGKKLVIKYKKQDGTTETVDVSVKEILNDWTVVNPSENSAIELTKTVKPSGATDELSARVKLSGSEDNLIKIVDNALYVPGTAITAANTMAQCTKSELQVLEKAVLGTQIPGECGGEYTYPKHETAKYISGATSQHNADFLLDAALNDLSAFTTTLSGNTQQLSDTVNCVKRELDVTQENVLGMSVPDCGVNGDKTNFQYVPNEATNYISAATSFNSSDIILDRELKNANDNIGTLSGDAANIHTEINTIEASIGLASDGTISTFKGCVFGDNGPDTIVGAIQAFDSEICSLRESFNNVMVGSDTASAQMEVDKNGPYNKWLVNVRLSHGNASIMKDGTWEEVDVEGLEGKAMVLVGDDLIISDYSGSTMVVEPGQTEFTDTNVLRIVDIKYDYTTGAEYGNPKLQANGLYLSNIWGCGLYTENGEGTYKNRYSTDDSEGSSNYDYNNNVRGGYHD